jgi:hypothetical protein
MIHFLPNFISRNAERYAEMLGYNPFPKTDGAVISALVARHYPLLASNKVLRKRKPLSLKGTKSIGVAAPCYLLQMTFSRKGSLRNDTGPNQ